MLFLSHWRRSAYGPSPPAPGDPRREAAGTGERGAARLARQRAAIQRLLGGWRNAASRRPPPPPPLAAGRAPLSPEQFVARAGGGPAGYESLSLELFMLGCVRTLEQELGTPRPGAPSPVPARAAGAGPPCLAPRPLPVLSQKSGFFHPVCKKAD